MSRRRPSIVILFASSGERTDKRNRSGWEPASVGERRTLEKEVPVMALDSRLRVLLSLAVAASAVGIGSITAAASSGSPAPNGSAAVVRGAPLSAAVVARNAASTAIACPAGAETGFAASAPASAVTCGTVFPCCGPSAQSGVTATGTATVNGSGRAARDQAIHNAIADARDQASVAAAAAGAHLGSVVGIQISSYPMAIPLAGAAGSSGFVQPSCPPDAKCPVPATRPSVSASVTVTWSLG
jgi:hypothetical protein